MGFGSWACSGGDDGASGPAPSGVWTLRSVQSGQQPFTVEYGNGDRQTASVSIEVAESILRDFVPLPVSGTFKVVVRPVGEGAEAALIDARGHRVGSVTALQPVGGGWRGTLITGQVDPPAKRIEGACRVDQRSGVEIEVSEAGFSAEQFVELRFTRPPSTDPDCDSALDEDLGMGAEGGLSRAVASGVVDPDRAGEMSGLRRGSPLEARRQSNQAPADLPGPDPDARGAGGGALTLTVPPFVGVGLSVEFEGFLEASSEAEDRTLTVEVTPEGGQAETFELSADVLGRFRGSYGPPAEGTYALAVIQDRTGIFVERTFEVVAFVGAAGLADRIAEELEGGFELADEVLVQFEEVLDELPPSSDESELRATVAQLRSQVAQAQREAGNVAARLQPLFEAAQAEPALGQHLGTELAALSSWVDEGTRLRTQYRDLLNQNRVQAAICDQLEYGAEAFALLSTLMNFAAGPTGILINIMTDKLLPASLAPLPFQDETRRFAVTEGAKEAFTAIQGYDALRGSVLGLVGDTAKFVLERIQAALCVRFQGPVSFQFTQEGLEAGAVWNRTSQRASGKIVVRYEKSATTMPIQVTGHIEGNFTKMDFWEDYKLVDDPADYNLVELVSFRITVPVTPFDAARYDPGFGMFSRAALPGYFLIPIRGQIQDRTLALTLEPAAVDAPLLDNQLVVILFEPITLIPQVFVFDFPPRRASEILGDLMDPVFEVTLQTEGGAIRFKRSAQRSGQSGIVTGDWSLSLEGTASP